MPITRFWGRDAEALFDALPAGTKYYPEGGAWAVQMAERPLRDLADTVGECIVTDSNDNDDRMTVAIVVLDHPDLARPVTIREDLGIGFPLDTTEWIWTQGNSSCDCNRSRAIIRAGIDFHELGCGDTIELTKMLVYREDVPWRVKDGPARAHPNRKSSP